MSLSSFVVSKFSYINFLNLNIKNYYSKFGLVLSAINIYSNAFFLLLILSNKNIAYEMLKSVESGNFFTPI